MIVDEFSGRVMDGRRWGDGLHQSIEAREALTVQPETETIASITYQVYRHTRVRNPGPSLLLLSSTHR